MIHDIAQHLTEDELHDAADGTQASGAAGRTTRHLIHCARCRADVERIRELLALAASLPRSIEPPADLWPEIGTRIARGGGAAASAGSGAGAVGTTDAVDPSGVARSPARHLRWDSVLRDRRWLAAAAVLLIAISSAVTMLVIRNDSPA